MITVPHLEEQLAKTEFYHEKICIVLFSQTTFEAMWEMEEDIHEPILNAVQHLTE